MNTPDANTTPPTHAADADCTSGPILALDTPVRCGHTGTPPQTPTAADGGARNAYPAVTTQLVIQILPRHPSSHATAHWHDLTHRHHGVLTTIADMQRWIELVGNPNYHHRIIERTETIIASTRRSSDPAASVRLIAVRQNA